MIEFLLSSAAAGGLLAAGWFARSWWERRPARPQLNSGSIRERQHVSHDVRNSQRAWFRLFDLDMCRAHRIRNCEHCLAAYRSGSGTSG